MQPGVLGLLSSHPHVVGFRLNQRARQLCNGCPGSPYASGAYGMHAILLRFPDFGLLGQCRGPNALHTAVGRPWWLPTPLLPRARLSYPSLPQTAYPGFRGFCVPVSLVCPCGDFGDIPTWGMRAVGSASPRTAAAPLALAKIGQHADRLIPGQ